MSNVETLQSECTAYSVSKSELKLQKYSVKLHPQTFAHLQSSGGGGMSQLARWGKGMSQVVQTGRGWSVVQMGGGWGGVVVHGWGMSQVVRWRGNKGGGEKLRNQVT